ncbi:uncharacterized protein ARMOST_02606 [Armillaria ostoyae]|uniref:Uncharacterized protein n=1 Tax=Armillaria ostoyae TaxID=47428 RepID=A0A284QSC9_ARMOS|nr:uncharacterized protein ARMOST_02606 [Armillaria ostoyae]
MIGGLPSRFYRYIVKIRQKKDSTLLFYVDCTCGGENASARGSPYINSVSQKEHGEAHTNSTSLSPLAVTFQPINNAHRRSPSTHPQSKHEHYQIHARSDGFFEYKWDDNDTAFGMMQIQSTYRRVCDLDLIRGGSIAPSRYGRSSLELSLM